MVLFNHATREMTAKIVYYGPGLCGKTTNLMVIFDKLDPKQKGKMLSLATKTDRTLFFDLLPVDIGKVGAFNLKIQLYTVPGQVFYNETRKLVLKGADSIVFVADSQPAMIDANRESFANLLENLRENQIDPEDTPIIIQYNKRDIPGVLPVEQLQDALSFEGYPYMEASALRGDGVMETFKLASKVTAKHLMNRLKGVKGEPVRKPAAEAKAARAAAKAAPSPAAAPAPSPVAVAEPPAPPEPAFNPFADAFATAPFDETPPISAYDKMEEVSLEQLLMEGRERPATMSGNVPVPMHEIEELAPEDVIPIVDESPITVDIGADNSGMVMPSDRIAVLESRIEELNERLEVAATERKKVLETILKDLNKLTERVRAQLET